MDMAALCMSFGEDALRATYEQSCVGGFLSNGAFILEVALTCMAMSLKSERSCARIEKVRSWNNRSVLTSRLD